MPPRMLLMILLLEVSSSSSCRLAARATRQRRATTPQTQAIRAARRLSPRLLVRMAIIRFGARILSYRGGTPAAIGPLSRGIRALLRRCPPEGTHTEADHPGNDGDIGQVKHVPVEIASLPS